MKRFSLIFVEFMGWVFAFFYIFGFLRSGFTFSLLCSCFVPYTHAVFLHARVSISGAQSCTDFGVFLWNSWVGSFG